jgi:hypothetical protein
MPRSPATTQSRLPKGNAWTRVSIIIPTDWLKAVDRAAALAGLSRSYYVAIASHTAAQARISADNNKRRKR